MKKLFSGDKDGAIECFQKSLKTEQRNWMECKLSATELKALGK